MKTGIRPLCIALVLQFAAYFSYSQLTVSTAMTPTQLVQNVLVGTGVTVSNVTFNGASGSIGSFVTGTTPTNLGFADGIIMSTGQVASTPAIGSPASNQVSTSNSYGSDPDLVALINDDVLDAAVLEFDFVPLSDTIKFKYVFGSEEYPEFVGMNVNDVFGFFVSGPNPIGGNYVKKNIALIPGTSVPVSIDNVNAGSYSSWFIDNLGISGQTIVYDGFTKVLTAWCLVVPCVQYHLKLAIGDGGDGVWDSGVFLKKNSFSGGAVTISQFPSVPAVGNNAVEGCNDITVHFTLQTPQTSAYPVSFGISGTATNGVDYTSIPNSVLIPAGQTSADVVIHPLTDGITEGTETVILSVQTSICGNTTDVVVNITDNTPLVITASNDTTICGGAATLTGSASGGIIPYTYAWSNGLGSGTTVTVSPTTTTNYSFSVTDACGSTATEGITVNAGVGVAEAGNDVTLCEGQGTTLVATGGAAYQWSNGVNAAINPVSPASTTTYYVTAQGTCSGYDSVTVYVNPNPVITATSSLGNILMGQTVTLTATGGNTYQWSGTPFDGSLSGQANSASPTVQPMFTTVYTVVGSSANGCTGSASVTVIVTPVLPEVNFFGAPVSGCEPLIVQFYDSTFKAAPGATWLWDFGNGTTSNMKNPQAYYPEHGTYNVSLTVSNPGGYGMTMTAEAYVTVYPLPVAIMTVLPNREVFLMDNPIGFFDQSFGNPVKWSWSFGDGDTSDQASVYHNYSDTGVFNVSMFVANEFGCKDSAFTTVVVRPEMHIFIPSAFTPNNDGRNDVFAIQSVGILDGSYRIRIFDRWGEEIFFSNDPANSWDGTWKGKPAVLGSYVYIIEYTDIESHDHTAKGTVTIYR